MVKRIKGNSFGNAYKHEYQLQNQTPAKKSNLYSWYSGLSTTAKMVAGAATVGVTALTSFMVQTTLFNFRFSFTPYLPGALRSAISTYRGAILSIPHFPNDYPSPLMTALNSIIVDPFVEEGIFRVGIQYLLVRQIQKVVLGRLYPNRPELIDSMASKITRVAIAAIFFGLYHCREDVCASAMENPLYKSATPEIKKIVERDCQSIVDVQVISMTTVTGVVWGAAMEVFQSPLAPWMLHTANNMLGRTWALMTR